MKKCKKCGKPRNHNNPLLSLCKECYYEKQLKNKSQMKFTEIKRTPLKRSEKPINKVGAKRKKRLKEGGSEVKIFEKVMEIDNNCWECGKPVGEPISWTFPHILNKKDYPAFRLITANIARACSDEHHKAIDVKVTAVKRDFEKLKELKDAILKLDRKKVKKLLQCI